MLFFLIYSLYFLIFLFLPARKTLGMSLEAQNHLFEEVKMLVLKGN